LRDELTPQGQRTWAEVAALAGNGMTYNSVRRRYSTYKIREKLADRQKEGYAALCGAPYITPGEVMQKIESGNHIVEPNELVQVSEIAALCRGGKSKEFKTVGAPPVLQEATSEQSETSTISDCLIVEDVEEVPTTRLGPKIPHEYNQLIFDLRESGKTFAQIVEALGEKGIVCTIGDASPRYYAMKRKLDAPVAEKQELEPTYKPDPKLDYQEVVDSKIINMKKRGMLNHEIAQVLERNPGGSWTTQKVDARWTQLRREGLA
jgi:hypothetical protein